MDTPPQKIDMGRKGLWFGLLGGATAWTLHLLFAYGAAEFGCVGHLGERSYAGISLVAWIELALTAAATCCSAAATIVAYRCHRRLQAGAETPSASDRYLAKLSMLTSGMFTFIILFESIPILFYLRHC